MATVLLHLEAICNGGDHAIVSAKVNQQAAEDYAITVGDLFNNWTAEDERLAAFYLTKLLAIGKTKNQLRTALNAGVTITI